MSQSVKLVIGRFGRHCQRRLPPRTAVMLHDVVMAGLAWWLAYGLRYIYMPWSTPAFSGVETLIVLVIQAWVFNRIGLYRGIWRFASLPDLWNIVRAVVIGAALIGCCLFLYSRSSGVPRSVVFIYPLVLALLLGLPRLGYRVWKDTRQARSAQANTVVLIIGAGESAEALARELRRDPRYRVIGFVDDAPQLRGALLNGLPVLGPLQALPSLVYRSGVGLLLIAQPAIDGAGMRRIVEACASTGVAYRTIPRIEDVLAGRAQLADTQEVKIEDLLGRASVELDHRWLAGHLTGQRVLVTGGGGSIGSELCRQLCRLGVRELTIVEQCEFNLYAISKELSEAYPELRLDDVLADCGDLPAMQRLFEQFKPQLVFHAAAYKHVPLLQEQVRAAFRNNVMTTQLLSELADKHSVSSFVLISTDKAVNPSSVMGACKRLGEIWCQNLDARSKTRFITVRFGNVLDSAGSVVPLFREQIRRGGPVTVTDPEVTRYFMTIPEACQLILQGAAQGLGGEIFALDMGEPIRIRDLAEQMIRLAGKQPGVDIAITYTGLRPGEKLSEELFHPQEQYSTTQHSKIFLAKYKPYHWHLLKREFSHAANAVAYYDEQALMRCISAILPSYMWADNPLSNSVVALYPEKSGDIE